MTQDVLLGASGGRSAGEQRKAFEEYHQAPLREGRLERVWDRVVSGAVLGSEQFVAGVRKDWQRGRLKLQELAALSGGVGYTEVALAIQRVREQIRRDKGLRRRIDAVTAQLSKVKR